MTTAALYARFSSEKQSESSTADQHRICEQRAALDGLRVVARHADQGVSGATPVEARPGGRALLADALAGRFSTLVVESLDRLSRDQVELERIVRRLEHRGIRIVGVSDGYDSAAAGRKVIRAVRGIVAELYLDDLKAKTHRGLTGKILAGFSAGGRSYGYRSVEEAGGRRLVIDEAEARWVRWIFERFAADGWSVKRIAHRLNELAVPAPRSGTWAASCIYGSARQGTGLLNNELYVGRLVWNRRQWIKDPDTGRRQKFDRPPSEWQMRDCPELRIVDDDLWRVTRARMDAPARAGGWGGKGRAPRTLFGGLLQCGLCGGAVVAISATHYGCAARKDRGATVCAGLTTPRDDTDRRLLSVVRDEIVSPEALAEFQRVVREVADSGAAAAREARRAREARLAELQREVGNLVSALASAGSSPAIIARLQAAEVERAALEAEQDDQASSGGIDMAAALAEYRRRAVALADALDRDRDRARQLLADLLGRVTIQRDETGVYADLEMQEPARLLVAGSLGAVAGTRFRNSRRIRIR